MYRKQRFFLVSNRQGFLFRYVVLALKLPKLALISTKNKEIKKKEQANENKTIIPGMHCDVKNNIRM